MIGNGARGEGGGQLGVRAAERALDREIDQGIVGAQALADAPLAIARGGPSSFSGRL